jgi:hypothetical protein
MSIESKVNDLERKIEDLSAKLDNIDQARTDKEIDIGKSIESYSHNYAAWLNSDLERDKSILTLSVAGLGLLLTLSQNSNEKNIYFIVFIIINAIGFLISTWSIISIFKMNKDLIKSIIKEEKPWQRSHIVYQLNYLDKLAYYSFITSMLMSFIMIAMKLLIGYFS